MTWIVITGLTLSSSEPPPPCGRIKIPVIAAGPSYQTFHELSVNRQLYLILGISYLIETKKGGVVAPAVTFLDTGCNTRKVVV